MPDGSGRGIVQRLPGWGGGCEDYPCAADLGKDNGKISSVISGGRLRLFVKRTVLIIYDDKT